MGNNRLNERNSKTYLRQRKNLPIKNQGQVKKETLVFGFTNIDRSQGQKFADWEELKLLSKALERISGLSSMTLEQAVTEQIIKIYGKGMPPKSGFIFPKHIPEDIEWASIRIQGQERIIGFIEKGYIFQVVFMDKEHQFYPSNKKHT